MPGKDRLNLHAVGSGWIYVLTQMAAWSVMLTHVCTHVLCDTRSFGRMGQLSGSNKVVMNVRNRL